MKSITSYRLNISGCRLQILLSWFLVLSSLTTFSQSASPYSRYGLGYVRSTVFSANKAMGEVAAPYASSVNINFTNPASYASLTRTTVELGANVDGVNIVTNDSTYKSTQGSISHFALAFAPAARLPDLRPSNRQSRTR